MPAEPGPVMSSGRPRAPGSSAVSSSGGKQLCDSTVSQFFLETTASKLGRFQTPLTGPV
jgi:hypothetical protein